MTGAQGSFAVGDWLVEPGLSQISTASETVHLRPQLMEVLVYLASLEGRVVTLESIHDDLWSGKVVSSGTIYNCVAELRQAFARSGSNIEYIETLPKKGYRLAPPIIARPAETGAVAGDCSIAILPLINRSNNPDIEYLCEGISDEILFGLSNVNGLKAYSASPLKAEKLDTRIVGLRYKAKMVLSGNLQSSGKKLRAIFRLENVSDGEILWSGRFEQTLDDLFELQETVAREVLDALSPTLPGSHRDDGVLEGSGTRSLDALNAFLMGKYALSRSTQSSHTEAISYFERAVTIDPGFARAHYLLYLSRYLSCRHFGAGADAIHKARQAAKDAQKNGFKPAVPWIHIHRRLHPADRLTSRELGLEAIDNLHARDPEWSSFAYEQLTWVLTDAGLFNAAVEFAKRMLASPSHNFEDSDADEEIPHYVAACRNYEEAIRLWSGLIQKEPARPLFHCERSILYARLGQFDHATKDIVATSTPRHAILARAFLAYYRGDIEETSQQHEALLKLPYVHATYPLWTYCLTGDIDGGLDQYEIAVNDENQSFIDFGNVRAMSRGKLPGKLVKELESHPKFAVLMKQEGIDDCWQAELIRRLNDISVITGIVVRPDE